MLPRKHLIPLRKEFTLIKNCGLMHGSRSFGAIVFRRPLSPIKFPRTAFVVSKKIDSRSVVRHQVKRRMAEAFGQLLPSLPNDLDIVFLVRQSATSMSVEDLKKEIMAILRNTGMAGIN